MSLRTAFGGMKIRKHLKETFDSVKLGPVTYTPEKRIDNVTHVAAFQAEFTGVRKEDGQKIKGGVTYGLDGMGFLVVSGPAP